VLHLAMPGLEIAQAVPRPRETVTAFLRRTGWGRHAADAEDHGLTINDELLAAVLEGCIDDPREAASPIVAVAHE
jgi:hypothetical protein